MGECSEDVGTVNEPLPVQQPSTASLEMVKARENLRHYLLSSTLRGFRADGICFGSQRTLDILGIQVDADGWGEFEGRAVKRHDWIEREWMALMNCSREEWEQGKFTREMAK